MLTAKDIQRGFDGYTTRELAFIEAVASGMTRVRHIAVHMEVDKPVVTRLTDQFIKLGMVHRIADEDDRRDVIVRPTPEGLSFVRALHKTLNEKKPKPAPVDGGVQEALL